MVTDYCLARWPLAFKDSIFEFFGLGREPKFEFVRHLIEVKGFVPNEEEVVLLKDIYKDRAEEYFSQSTNKPKWIDGG